MVQATFTHPLDAPQDVASIQVVRVAPSTNGISSDVPLPVAAANSLLVFADAPAGRGGSLEVSEANSRTVRWKGRLNLHPVANATTTAVTLCYCVLLLSEDRTQGRHYQGQLSLPGHTFVVPVFRGVDGQFPEASLAIHQVRVANPTFRLLAVGQVTYANQPTFALDPADEWAWAPSHLTYVPSSPSSGN